MPDEIHYMRGDAKSFSGVCTGASQVLCAANGERRGLAIQNQGANDMYLRALVQATPDNLCLKIAAGLYYEVPIVSPGIYYLFGTAADTFFCITW